MIRNSFHSISLSILLSFLSQMFSSHSNLCSSRIFQAFSRISSLVVSEEPKHRSTPARNPLHSRASSSSDLTLSHIWFRDEDAYKAFSENFSRRGIHSERQVILSDFADTDLPSIIHSRGWESLCDVPVTCPLMLIQEFYSNMHGIDRSIPLFFTHV